MKKYSQETIVNHLKTQGFVFPGSQIYGGLANSWDYGPLGSQLKKNIKDTWWLEFVMKDSNAVGMDSSILMSPEIWKTSGHIGGFSDPLMDCKECKNRLRADKLVESVFNNINAGEMSKVSLENFIKENDIKCPKCGLSNWTSIREFNLMFKTHQGVTEDAQAIYLRPETAQGIYINFKNVQRTSRLKVPFAIGQIGKSFRNEITPGNFIFRTREFEQMELQYFVKPGEDESKYNELVEKVSYFLTHKLGISENNLVKRIHGEKELAHYAKSTIDFEYKFPFGTGELWGIANRTDFDLKNHQNASGEKFEYLDPSDNSKYIPYVIEPSVGVERLFLAACCDAYEEETLDDGNERVVMRFKKEIAPYTCAVLPLVKKLRDKSHEIYNLLLEQGIRVTFDEAANIGKRYRRQDAIGTPYCITIDYDTLEDGCVTLRDRDTMEQIRVPISQISKHI